MTYCKNCGHDPLRGSFKTNLNEHGYCTYCQQEGIHCYADKEKLRNLKKQHNDNYKNDQFGNEFNDQFQYYGY